MFFMQMIHRRQPKDSSLLFCLTARYRNFRKTKEYVPSGIHAVPSSSNQLIDELLPRLNTVFIDFPRTLRMLLMTKIVVFPNRAKGKEWERSREDEGRRQEEGGRGKEGGREAGGRGKVRREEE